MTTTRVHMERSSHVRGLVCSICNGIAGATSVPRALEAPATDARRGAAALEVPPDGVVCTVALVVPGTSAKKFVCAFCSRGISIAMLGAAAKR